LFTYKKGKVFVALLVYVDDLVLAGNDANVCVDFNAYLHNYFCTMDLGPLKYFSRIEVAWASKGTCSS